MSLVVHHDILGFIYVSEMSGLITQQAMRGPAWPVVMLSLKPPRPRSSSSLYICITANNYQLTDVIRFYCALKTLPIQAYYSA